MTDFPNCRCVLIPIYDPKPYDDGYDNLRAWCAELNAGQSKDRWYLGFIEVPVRTYDGSPRTFTRFSLILDRQIGARTARDSQQLSDADVYAGNDTPHSGKWIFARIVKRMTEQMDRFEADQPRRGE